MLRQLIEYLPPRGFRGDEDVSLRPVRQRRIHRTQPDAYNFRRAVAAAQDGRAAVSAELPMHALGRAEGLQRLLPRNHDEILGRCHGIGCEGRAAGLATTRAVAIDGGFEFTAHFVFDGTAKTAAFVHECLLSVTDEKK